MLLYRGYWIRVLNIPQNIASTFSILGRVIWAHFQGSYKRKSEIRPYVMPKNDQIESK